MTRDEAIKMVGDLLAESEYLQPDKKIAREKAAIVITTVYDSIYRAGYDDGHTAGIEELMGMHKEHD